VAMLPQIGSVLPRIDIEPQKKPRLRSVSILISIAVVLGLFVVLFYGNPVGGLLWSGACLFAGALVGFLFGIPKTVADPKSSDSQKPNTNLEDISDWMTKIIVGLGLAQIHRIPPKLQEAAGYIAYTWGPAPANSAFSYALMLYFSVVGFLGGYLLTRIFLSPLLRTADSPLQGFVGERTSASITGLVTSQPAAAPAAQDPAAHATAAVMKAYADLDRKEAPTVLKQDISALSDLASAFPVFRGLYIVLGRLYRALDDYDSAMDVLTKFIANKTKAGQSGDGDTAAAYYNLACYCVRKAETTKKNGQLLDQAKADLEQALKRSDEYFQYAEQDPDLAIEPIQTFVQDLKRSTGRN